MSSSRLLLTSVFGPYGVADEYADGFGMLMDGLKVHLTLGQGVHAPQGAYGTFSLDLLAANLETPVTVLDFPKWKHFTAELRRGYTHVGISFIAANVWKARRMAEYMREHYPETRIFLGGYGCLIPEVSDIVPNDGVCRGEGIRWLREQMGENTDRPIEHPFVKYPAKMRMYGIDIASRLRGAVLIPGLGCKGACDFCSTTHKFNYDYLPLFPDGRALFNWCMEAERRLGSELFPLLDENFIGNSGFARELGIAMEERGKLYRYTIWVTARDLPAFGVDALVRWGFEQVWIGVESRNAEYAKLRGVDIKALIADLQAHGIAVTTSSILFLDEHRKDTIRGEIQWAVDLAGELHQFPMVTPMPGTALHGRYASENRLSPDRDYRALHAMDLCITHPEFSREEAAAIQREAYRLKYETHGPSTLNRCITLIRGYRRAVDDLEAREAGGLRWNAQTLRYEQASAPAPDPYMQRRVQQMRRRTREARPLLLTCLVFAPNENIRDRVRETMRLYRQTFGLMGVAGCCIAAGVLASATLQHFRIRIARVLGRVVPDDQPPTRRTEYSCHNSGGNDS